MFGRPKHVLIPTIIAATGGILLYAGIGIIKTDSISARTESYISNDYRTPNNLSPTPRPDQSSIEITTTYEVTATTSDKQDETKTPEETNEEPVAKKEPEPITKPKAVYEPVIPPVLPPPPPEIDEPIEDKKDNLKYTLTSSDIESIIRDHNDWRSQVGQSPLVWSDDLAKSAQGWSEQLASESCVMRHDFNTPYGENIFWQEQTGGDISGLVSTPADAVFWWGDEKRFYNYSKNTCRPGEQCGHYTQIVWNTTRKVGCGVSSCSSGNRRTDVWVCRYDPPGNIVNTRPY